MVGRRSGFLFGAKGLFSKGHVKLPGSIITGKGRLAKNLEIETGLFVTGNFRRRTESWPADLRTTYGNFAEVEAHVYG